MTEAPLLTVGVINYNACDWLGPCLRSVLRETANLSAEVIVVDNASSDDSLVMLRRDFPEVGVEVLPENRGYAVGCNTAAQVGSGRYVLFLNPDVELRPGCLAVLLAFAESNERAGIVGPRLLNSDGTHQASCKMFPSVIGYLQEAVFLPKLLPAWGPVARRHATRFDGSRPQPVEVLLGAFLLCRRALLDHLGGLDERFFMYSEEVDLCYRAMQAGWEVWYRPEAAAVHHGGKSTEPVAASMFAELHRSKLRFLRYHRSPPVVGAARVCLALGTFLRGLLWSLAFLVAAPFSPRWRRRLACRATPFWAAFAAHLRP